MPDRPDSERARWLARPLGAAAARRPARSYTSTLIPHGEVARPQVTRRGPERLQVGGGERQWPADGENTRELLDDTDACLVRRRPAPPADMFDRMPEVDSGALMPPESLPPERWVDGDGAETDVMDAPGPRVSYHSIPPFAPRDVPAPMRSTVVIDHQPDTRVLRLGQVATWPPSPAGHESRAMFAALDRPGRVRGYQFVPWEHRVMTPEERAHRSLVGTVILSAIVAVLTGLIAGTLLPMWMQGG